MTPQHKIKQLIGLGKSQDAIRFLLESTDPDHPSFNDVIILSSNYHNLIEEYTEGILSSEEKRIGLNKINKRLLALADKLKAETSATTGGASASQDRQEIPAPAAESEAQKSKIEIRIDKPFDRYSEGEKKNLFNALENLLRLPQTSVTILSVAAGSIIYTLEMPSKYALKLYWLIKLGALEELKVIDAKLLGNALKPLGPLASITGGNGLAAIWSRLKFWIIGLFLGLGIIGFVYFSSTTKSTSVSNIPSNYEQKSSIKNGTNLNLDSTAVSVIEEEKEKVSSPTTVIALPEKSKREESKQENEGADIVLSSGTEETLEAHKLEELTEKRGYQTAAQATTSRKEKVAANYVNKIKRKFKRKERFSIEVRGSDAAQKKYNAVGKAIFYKTGEFEAEYSFKVKTPESGELRYFYRTTFLFKNKDGKVIYTLTTPMFLMDYKYREKLPEEPFKTFLPVEVVVGVKTIEYDIENSSSTSKTVPSSVLELVDQAIADNKSITSISSKKLSSDFDAQIDVINQEMRNLTANIKLIEDEIKTLTREKSKIRNAERDKGGSSGKKKKKKKKSVAKVTLSPAAEKKINEIKEKIEAKRLEAEDLKRTRKSLNNNINNLRQNERAASNYLKWYKANMKEKKVPNDDLLLQITNEIYKSGTSPEEIVRQLNEKK